MVENYLKINVINKNTGIFKAMYIYIYIMLTLTTNVTDIGIYS